MALLDVDHLIGTNPNSHDREPVTEDLFVLTVGTMVTYNKAVHLGVLALYRMFSQLLELNAEWNNAAILYMHSQLLERTAEWNNELSNTHNPGYQSGQRALPSRRQERLAAFEGVAYAEEDYEHYVEDYDVGELYYYNTNFRSPDLPGVTQPADYQDNSL